MSFVDIARKSNQVKYLKIELDRIQKQIKEIQDNCTHDKASEYTTNIFYCPVCDKTFGVI